MFRICQTIRNLTLSMWKNKQSRDEESNSHELRIPVSAVKVQRLRKAQVRNPNSRVSYWVATMTSTGISPHLSTAPAQPVYHWLTFFKCVLSQNCLTLPYRLYFPEYFERNELDKDFNFFRYPEVLQVEAFSRLRQVFDKISACSMSFPVHETSMSS